MIRTLPLLTTVALAGLVTTTAPALASDPRLAARAYSQNEVVRIDGRTGVQATIAFADDEHIENVAIGDSNSWQVTPNKRANRLFVKPLAGTARTNMTVVTDRYTYYFDLVASPSARPLYELRFTYPERKKEQEAAARLAAAPALTSEESAIAAGGDQARPADPASLNFAWEQKGKAALLPSRIYDDGQSTYVTWAAGNPVPAILIRDAKGTEGPVNYAVRGDVIVIEGVPTLIVLRSGKDAATLARSATAPVGAPATATPTAATPATATPAPQALAAATQPKGA
ncbi:MAG: TrbG/VirB9 family P-type conjugative transfer protein [Novosphingobium sp.]